MASRDIGGSIQAALRDLFDERAIVEDAIDKLQSLLESMKVSMTGKRRGRPPGKVGKRRGRPPGSKTKRRSTRSNVTQPASERIKKLWSKKKKVSKNAVTAVTKKRRGRPPGKKKTKRA